MKLTIKDRPRCACGRPSIKVKQQAGVCAVCDSREKPGVQHKVRRVFSWNDERRRKGLSETQLVGQFHFSEK